jgi:FMN-dependent NADH-azoreductase
METAMTRTDSRLHLLHLDSSARFGRGGLEPHGSWSRRLSDAFARRWRDARPHDGYTYRDLAAQPPRPMPGNWVQAAYSPAAGRGPELQAALADSNELIAELRAADVLVVGMPMYNYGMPSPLKAWSDLVVRMGETVTATRDGGAVVYTPLLADRPRRAVLLASRGAEGFGPGGRYEAMNHADTAMRGVLEFIGITDIETLAVEGEELGGAHFEAIVAGALAQVDALVARWSGLGEPVAA